MKDYNDCYGLPKTTDVESKIDLWAESFVNRIMEVRLFDPLEIRQILKTQMKLSFYEILESQISETKRKLNQAKIIAANSGKHQLSRASDVIKLKEKFQKEHNLKTELQAIKKKERDNKKLLLFHDICFEKFGKEVMIELDAEFKKRLTSEPR